MFNAIRADALFDNFLARLLILYCTLVMKNYETLKGISYKN